MIYVLGSVNYDMNLNVKRMPEEGETLLADGYSSGLGGKGANQAIAVAKLGGSHSVSFIGSVGNDEIGKYLVVQLNKYGVDTSFIRKVGFESGRAVVIRHGGNNRIIVIRGANAYLGASDVDRALKNAGKGDTLLCQLEVPADVVAHALEFAKGRGMTTVLNPAPAIKLSERVYANSDVIIPNETETKLLTGINPSGTGATERAIKKLHSFGASYVIITQGSSGCTASDGQSIVHVPALPVKVVDTTAAGDTFVGAFAITYPKAGRLNFIEAVNFATRAASVTVTRLGAASSIPTFDEVQKLYDKPIN